jgi:hypothetical protein
MKLNHLDLVEIALVGKITRKTTNELALSAKKENFLTWQKADC